MEGAMTKKGTNKGNRAARIAASVQAGELQSLSTALRRTGAGNDTLLERAAMQLEALRKTLRAQCRSLNLEEREVLRAADNEIPPAGDEKYQRALTTATWIRRLQRDVEAATGGQETERRGRRPPPT
jgi:hypothetical protein